MSSVKTIATGIWDVAGYLVSPFLPFNRFERNLGFIGSIFSATLYKLGDRLYDYRFKVEVLTENMGWTHIPKKDAVMLVMIFKRLHENGMRHYLEEFPYDAVDFFQKHYTDAKEKPVEVIDISNEYPLKDFGIQAKVLLFEWKKEEPVEVTEEDFRKLFEKAEEQMGGKKEVIAEYDDEKAEVVETRGDVKITRYDEQLFAVKTVTVKRRNGRYAVELGGEEAVISPSLDNIIQSNVQSLMLYANWMGYDIVGKPIVQKSEEGNTIKILIAIPVSK